MLLGEVVDQALQVVGVVRERVVVVEAVDLQVVQFDVLVDVNPLRVHLGHVLHGGGDAEVVALGVLELAADALDLVLVGAGPQRGGERAHASESSVVPRRSPGKRRRGEVARGETADARGRRHRGRWAGRSVAGERRGGEERASQ